MFVLYLILLLVTSTALQAKEEVSSHIVCSSSEKSCKDLNNKCRCYCAWKCGPRDKEPDDEPVFIKDDPNGVYCYCKMRDYLAYEPRGCKLKDKVLGRNKFFDKKMASFEVKSTK